MQTLKNNREQVIIVGANFLEEKLRKMFLTMNEMFHESQENTYNCINI